MKLCVLISTLTEMDDPLDIFDGTKLNRKKVQFWKSKGYKATIIDKVGYAIQLQRYASKNQRGYLNLETVSSSTVHDLYNYMIPEKLLEHEHDHMSLVVTCREIVYRSGGVHLHAHPHARPLRLAQGGYENICGSTETLEGIVQVIPRVSRCCDVTSFYFSSKQFVSYRRVEYRMPIHNELVRYRIVEKDDRPLEEHCYLSNTAKVLVHQASDLQNQMLQKHATKLIEPNKKI